MASLPIKPIAFTAIFTVWSGVSGCETDCIGAGCLERFGAASALMHLGAELPDEGEIEPTDAPVSIQGKTLQGPDWDVTINEGTVLIGSSFDNTVRSYAPIAGESITEQQAVGSLLGEHLSDRFGHRVRTVRTASGTADLLVSAPDLSTTADIRHVGGVYRFTGIGETFSGVLDVGDFALRMSGDAAGGRFGSALEICPDLDGDGEEEWLAAATHDSTTARLSGQVVLVRSGDMVDQPQQVGVGVIETRWTGQHLGELAGRSLDCQSDLDGDGTIDLVIGSPYADDDFGTDAVGVVHIISGATLPATGRLREAAAFSIQLGEDNDWLGWSIATGDLDGDGLADLVVGAPGVNDATGAVYLWSGVQLQSQDTQEPTVTLSGIGEAGRFGWSSHVADINADGVDDLLVGAPYENPTGENDAFNAGRVSVYFGGTDLSAWATEQTAVDAPLQFAEAEQYLRTGSAIFSGNFDGDSAADILFIHRAESN